MIQLPPSLLRPLDADRLRGGGEKKKEPQKALQPIIPDLVFDVISWLSLARPDHSKAAKKTNASPNLLLSNLFSKMKKKRKHAKFDMLSSL
jgi:hypothetical protein